MQIQRHAARVTGGGPGLGESTAREMARLGAKDGRAASLEDFARVIRLDARCAWRRVDHTEK